jgi:hypothetical protein
MKAQANKSRAKHPAHKPKQTAPLTRMLILDALRTWVIPTVAVSIGLVVFVLYNIELLEQAVAVTVAGTLGLIVVLFYGLRGFIEDTLDGRMVAILIVFAVLWSAATFYPFYRAVNPGPPLFATELSRDHPPVTLPLQGKPGRYNLVVEGHFLPAQGKENRTATYHITLGHEGQTDRVLEGAFHQEWGTQRIGAGRRSSLVPVMRQTTQGLETIEDPEGRDLTVKLTDLSPGVMDTVSLRVYAEGFMKPLLIVLGVLTIAASVVLDAWRPKGVSEGLLATLTVATLLSIVTFRASNVAALGFPQLVIAVLVGTLAGAIASGLLSRLIRPLRRYLPANP